MVLDIATDKQVTIGRCRHKGLCKEKNSKNPRLLWKWVGGSRSHSEFFCVGKSSQNSPKPVLIFWSSIPCVGPILSVYTLLKVVGYYDLSILTMSMMVCQKKFGWLRPIQFCGIFGICLPLHGP